MEKLDYMNYRNDSRVKTKNNFNYILPENFNKYEIQEWFKCKLDPLYFIKNYIYVMVESTGERLPLSEIIYPPQEELIINLFEKRKVIVLKSRQTGITTIISQLCQYLLLFNRQYKIGILSHKSEHQSGFVDRKLKVLLSMLPPIFLKPVSTNNKQQIIFQDGDDEESWIQQEAPGANSFPFTGETLNFMYIDEQQKISFIEKHFQSITPAMSTILNQPEVQQKKRPTGICVVSTPFGIDGIGKWFYNKYESNKLQKPPDYYPMFIHWRDCGLDDDWYHQQKSLYNNDQRLIRQELDQEFLGSGETYYQLDHLLKLDHKPFTLKEISWKRSQQGEVVLENERIKLWEEPQDGVQYVIGVDPQDSDGDKSDYTQIQIINGYTQCQQQEWKGHINTVDMQFLVKEIQVYYNYQLLAIEKNKGFHLIDKLLYGDDPYDNIYSDKKGSMGITVTGQSRKIIIDMISVLLPDYNKDIFDFIKSKDLIDNLFSFEWRMGKSSYRGEQKSGKHDDLIFQFQYALFQRENTMSSLLKDTTVNLQAKTESHQVQHQYDMIDLIKKIRG